MKHANLERHYQVLIIGGGSAGIMTAARLRNSDKSLNIAIIEPNDTHWYQAAWTLVGAGTYDLKSTGRPMGDLIPKGVKWLKDRATELHPERNAVSTIENGDIVYDYLIVAPGLVNDLDHIEGLEKALKTPEVCSNYVDPNKTWKVISNFKGGNAVFTMPDTPIKCGGGPQKIMYLAEEHFASIGVREKTQVVYPTLGSVIFGVEPFKKTMEAVVARKKIALKTFCVPIKIDSDRKEIHFKYLKSEESPRHTAPDEKIKERWIDEKTVIMPYDMLHLAPPQKAPDFVSQSVLSYQEGPSKGWMEVDKFSLQHPSFKNVFGLGDVAALPTAKTGAAVRKQAPVVVKHILNMMKANQLSEARYEGYSSCPLITGYSTMVLAEFKYDNVRDSDPFISKFVDTSKEKWSMWLLKKYGLPWLYWNRMMKGKM